MIARILTIFAAVLFSSLITLAQDIKPNRLEITAFEKADSDQNLVLSKSEFRTFVREMAKGGQATARRIRFFHAYGFAFDIADKNKDGVVTPEELRAADDAQKRDPK